MKASEMLELLREVGRDKLALRQRHVAAARYVTDYELNNTYQYVIAREDVQIGWLHDAVADMGSRLDEVPEPDLKPDKKGAAAQSVLLTADRAAASEFVDKWTHRVDALPNARHRSMLRVILGETLEHLRFFEQALAGRTDLLGRRDEGAGTAGEVLPTRWVE